MKKVLAAGVVALAVLTVLALSAGIVLGNSGSVASSGAAPEVAGARGVSVVGPAIIGFESDASSAKTEPFSSVDNPTVHFVDAIGNSLSVANYGTQGNGQSLAAFADADDGGLTVVFDVPTTKLAVAFGNDDPAFSLAGDRITLSVYRNGRRVKTINVTMNRDDLMNQTVTYTGTTPIDKATVSFTRAGTGPIHLTEILDDFTMKWIYGIKGNGAGNTLRGTYLANGIYGAGGADTVFGWGGNDILAGGTGSDKLYPGDGNDLVDAGSGNDTIVTTDGVGGNDTVYGGPGVDTATIDSGDRTVDVENVSTL